MQKNDGIALVSMLKIEGRRMVGKEGRPARMYCNSSGGLDHDVAVKVLFHLF